MKKKVIIVTGASSGMGRELCRTIAGRYKVDAEYWLIARRRDRLEALKEELCRLGKRARVLELDLCSDEAFLSLRELLEAESPRIMILANASGFGKLGSFAGMDEDWISGMQKLNCIALSRMCRLCIPYMATGYGHIINFASAAAFSPMPHFAVYGATKAYVLSLSRALHEELRSRGITVTAVCPGPVRTEFFDIAEEREQAPLYKRFFMADPKRVCRKALRDALCGKPVSVYGIAIALLRAATKLLPISFILLVMMKLSDYED